MVLIKSVATGIMFLLLVSCTHSGSSEKLNLSRQDVVGTWKLSGESLVNLEKEKQNDKIVTRFQLHSDSTATIYFDNSDKKHWTGKWIWQAEKKLGNDVFGMSIETDVSISVSGLLMLGMQLEEENGKLNLAAADYLFEKQ